MFMRDMILPATSQRKRGGVFFYGAERCAQPRLTDARDTLGSPCRRLQQLVRPARRSTVRRSPDLSYDLSVRPNDSLQTR